MKDHLPAQPTKNEREIEVLKHNQQLLISYLNQTNDALYALAKTQVKPEEMAKALKDAEGIKTYVEAIQKINDKANENNPTT